MYEEQRERRVVRMTWDIDPATTNEMIRDTGVSVFEDDDRMELDAICKPASINHQTTSLVPKVVDLFFSKTRELLHEVYDVMYVSCNKTASFVFQSRPIYNMRKLPVLVLIFSECISIKNTIRMK
jgi:hypothetical protein